MTKKILGLVLLLSCLAMTAQAQTGNTKLLDGAMSPSEPPAATDVPLPKTPGTPGNVPGDVPMKGKHKLPIKIAPGNTPPHDGHSGPPPKGDHMPPPDGTNGNPPPPMDGNGPSDTPPPRP